MPQQTIPGPSTTGLAAGAKPRVLVISSTMREIDPVQWARVNETFEVIMYDCSSVEEFKNRLAPGGPYSQINAIVRTGWRNGGPFIDTIIFQPDFVQFYPKSLKIVCSAGHGYDAVDLDALASAGIWYCNTPGGAKEAVANTALYLILASYRYFSFAERCVREDGMWARKRELGTIATEPYQQVLGVVGFGDIGIEVARKASVGLGMEIHYFNPRRKPEAEASLAHGATYHESLDSLLSVADCICLACPYNAKTHHLMSSEQFANSKPSGLRLVNVARGKLVDEDALVKALDAGQVIGWASDVHENEPEIDERLKKNYMVTLLPHIGVCSRMSWRNFERQCLDTLEFFFYGESQGRRPSTARNNIE